MQSDGSKGVLLALGLVGLLLQACGGGGDGDNPAPPPQPAAKYTLSGTVRPAAGTATDSDVNDRFALHQPNDTLANAQSIPNPVTLGGYANRPGAGPGGRSRDAGDVRDIYRVGLLAGQQINLLIAGDGVRDDLDLALADLDGNILDAAASQNRMETLTVAASGDYLVAVVADRGASNYVLTIGQTLTSAGGGMRLSDPFVAGEAIVRFQRDAAARRDGLRAQARALGWVEAREAESEERNVLVGATKLKQVAIYRTLASEMPPGFPDGFRVADPALREKLRTLYLIKELKNDPDIADAGLNHIHRTLFVPNDPLFRFQWHYPQINLPQIWDLTTGADAIVAVIDTGVALGHPDLQGQLVDGYDFVRDRTSAGDGDGIDPDPSDPGDHSNPDGNSSFHGTHVTGTVAAATHNGIGVAGVAFGAKVMPLRALGRFGEGTSYDIEQAVRFAARLPNDSGTLPPRRADVINLSVGGRGSSTASQAVYDQARAAGVVIVAATGNEASSQPIFPAGYPGVIAVSAWISTRIWPTTLISGPGSAWPRPAATPAGT
jgi:serine protease